LQHIYILQAIYTNKPYKYKGGTYIIESDKKTIPKVDEINAEKDLYQALRKTSKAV
jgi:hypothetical protein